MESQVQMRELSDRERRDILEAKVQHAVSGKVRVESRTDTQAILVVGKKPNHILHLILSILTLGIWALFVWLPISLFGGEKRVVYSVAADGTALRDGKPF